MLKFRGLDLHADVTALADDMSFRVLFDFPHQQRILEAALRTRNVYRFVFNKLLQASGSIRRPDRLAANRVLQTDACHLPASRFGPVPTKAVRLCEL